MEKEEKIDEKSRELNVIIVGDNIAQQYLKNIFASETNDLPNPQTNCIKRFAIKQDKTFKWTYEIFYNGLSENDCEEITKRVKEDNQNKNVIVCFISRDIQNAKNLINAITELPTASHPFIIFIVQDKSISMNSINEWIQSEGISFDIRNIKLINFDGQSEINVINDLWEICCYYNELGQGLKLQNSTNLEFKRNTTQHCLNFFLVGKPGRGKSTFINILNGKKLAKESTGKPVTSRINKYFIKDYPIALYDCPGFSMNEGEGPKMLKKCIKDFYKEFKDTRDNIHGIFYFMSANDMRNYDNGEKDFIKFMLELEEKGIDIYFIVNFCSNSKKGIKKTKEFIKQLQYDLENDFKEDFEKLKFKERIFQINLVNTSDTEKGNCFGLDKLFEYLYSQYKDKIIQTSEMKTLTLKKINELVIKNELYKGKTDKEDILKNIKIKCHIEIAGFGTAAAAIGAIPFPFADVLPLYGLQASMVIAIAITFGVKLDKNKALAHVTSFSGSAGVAGAAGLIGKGIAYALKCIPGVGTVAGGIINASIASAATVAIGESTLALYCSQMTDENLIKIMINIAENYNLAINGFNSLKKEYENKDDYAALIN